MVNKERIILGIDPGTNIMGYAIIKTVGKQVSVILMGVIELKKYTDHYLKLKRIFERVSELIKQYHPDELAIEAPFFGKNAQSMLKLGRAQGVAMAAGLSFSMPIFEYAPRKIKMSITGQGAASKEQLALLLQKTLKIKDLPKDLDAKDALATAMCHYYQSNNPKTDKSFKSWKDFINKNPKRIK
ncbi:MAG: crossover junction endodeoxyribonuclease RuvC [Bacteroidales bacterium]|jgi:crossover junction endodeoxyribonuclease RuvC|nr:crossover junction endodeoxyribonuclease RuvC [Bacteroidales bacterium]